MINILILLHLLLFSGCASISEQPQIVKETPQIVKVATYGDLSTLESLISTGVDVNVDEGRALREASRRGDVEIIKALIKAGANINLATYWGRTPLIAATEESNMEAVKLLVKSGANLDSHVAVTKFQRPKFQRSAGGSMLDKLAGIEPPRTPDQYKVVDAETALMIASKYNDLEIVNILLEAGANVNLRPGIGGNTALSLAVDYGHKLVVEALINKGADVNQRYRKSRLSILEQSIKMGRIEIAELLITSGAEVK